MSEPPRHSVSVAGVIVDDAGRCLLIRRRDTAKWEIPGGILESGEPVEAGLVREVLEETGLFINPIGLTGVYKHTVLDVLALVFRCEIVKGDLTTNAEADAFRWCAINDLDPLVAEVFKVRILDAILYEGHPRVRAHDGRRILR